MSLSIVEVLEKKGPMTDIDLLKQLKSDLAVLESSTGN